MLFTELTAAEYNDFMMQTNLMSHYFQVKENIENREQSGQPVVLLGVKDQGEVIAAGLFSKIPSFGSYMYYSNRGPVMDYSNLELVNFYFSSLDKYLKRNQALSVKIDPYWIYQTYDKDVNIKTQGDAAVINELEALGYHHAGFTRGYTDTQVRWMSVLYLDNETPASLMKQFDSQRKRNIKKAEKYGVKIRLLKPEELDIFLDLYRETEERTGFISRDDEYFKGFAEHYGSKVIMPLAYIDLAEYTQKITNEIGELEAKRDQLMQKEPKSEKQLKKIEEMNQQHQQLQQNLFEANELIQTDGAVLNLAAGMFFENNYEINYFSGGSSAKYSQFMGPYAMHWYMINYSLENGFDRYNFYGVSGDFTESSEDYGVFRFKRGFNAQIEELLGDFTKTINKPKQALQNVLQKTNRGLKKLKNIRK